MMFPNMFGEHANRNVGALQPMTRAAYAAYDMHDTCQWVLFCHLPRTYPGYLYLGFHAMLDFSTLQQLIRH